MSQLERWPILYKKAKSGKVQVWEIWVRGNVIHSRSGQEDGKMRETSDTIKVGKNVGRANETTPHEQAKSEAQSKYDRQIDSGYNDDRDAALEGEVAGSQRGYFPQLAETYQDSRKHISFPCYIQPKLDGLRAPWDDGFFSRKRKPFKSVQHLGRELVRIGVDHLPLDGELYNHELRDEFQEIVGAVKRNKSDHPRLKDIQYHVYDIGLDDRDFDERLMMLRNLKEKFSKSKLVHLVETRFVRDEKELMAAYDEFVAQGYEGAMVRNAKGKYEFRRSNNLQKLKVMQDSEFRIIGIKEGRGSLQGHVGKFVCVVEDHLGDGLDKTFDVILKGTGRNKFLKDAFTKHSLWEGKWMQVQFQGWTKKNGKDNVPRFPVGMQIRDAE